MHFCFRVSAWIYMFISCWSQWVAFMILTGEPTLPSIFKLLPLDIGACFLGQVTVNYFQMTAASQPLRFGNKEKFGNWFLTILQGTVGRIKWPSTLDLERPSQMDE